MGWSEIFHLFEHAVHNYSILPQEMGPHMAELQDQRGHWEGQIQTYFFF